MQKALEEGCPSSSPDLFREGVLEKVQLEQLMQLCSDIPMLVRTARYAFRFEGHEGGRNLFFKIFPSGQRTFNFFSGFWGF